MSLIDEWGEIPPPENYEPQQESSSLPSRLGQQVANTPSELLNSIFSLGFNVGIKEPGQTKPEEAPKPYDIPAPTGPGEWAVDAVSELGRSLPFFMSGEGAAQGFANMAKLGPTATRIARYGAGFATQGLTESPEHAVTEGGLGLGMGAVEGVIPKAPRLVAAAMLGAATYGLRKHEGASDKEAGIAGVVNTALPWLSTWLRLRGLKNTTAKSSVEEATGGVKRLGYTPRLALEDVQQAYRVPGTGGPIPYGGELEESTTRARPIFGTETSTTTAEGAVWPSRFFPKDESVIEGEFTEGASRNGNGEAMPPPILALPQGDLPGHNRRIGFVEEPSLTVNEARNKMGQAPIEYPQPPEGSLIRRPEFTEPEARARANFERQKRGLPPIEEPEVATLQPEEPIGAVAVMNKFLTDAGRAPLSPAENVEGTSLKAEAAPPKAAVSQGEKGGMQAAANEDARLMRKINAAERRRWPLGPEKIATSQSEAPAAADKWADARLAESRMNYAETKLWEARNGKLGRITKKGLAEYEKAAQMFREQFDEALAAAKAAPKAEAEASVPPGVATSQPVTPNALVTKGKPGYIPTVDVLRMAQEKVGSEEFARLADAYAASRSRAVGSEAIAIERAARKIVAGEDLGVATLQHETGASTPSPLEPPEGISFGDRVQFKRTFEGETDILTGTIHPGEESGTFRLVERNGDIHDVPPRDIVTKPEGVGLDKLSDSPGTTLDLQAAKKKAQKAAGERGLPGGGKMRRSNFGEQGSVSFDTLESMTKWAAAPIAGGVIGYAYPDRDDERLHSAIAGAVIAGLIATGGFKIARRLAAAHPEVKVPGTTAERVSRVGTAAKDSVSRGWKAIWASDEMAQKAESQAGLADDYDKLARGIEKYMTTNPAVTRFMGKARGVIDEYAEMMHRSIRGLARLENIERHYLSLNRYFEGKMTPEDLKTIIPDVAYKLAMTATDARDALQKIVRTGLGDSKLSKEVEASIGSYLTTSYKIFHDPKYMPTEAQIIRAAASLGKEWGSMEIRIKDVRNYLNEVKMGKAIWGGTDEISGGRSVGALLQREKNLHPAMKDLLGEYDSPLQRMAFTAVKLVNGARNAEFFNEVARGVKSNGLKYAYGREEMDAMLATLQSDAKMAHSPTERAVAQAKLNELRGYVPNTDGPTTGRLSNQYMDRRMRDQLANYTVDIKAHAGPIVRGLMELANGIKYGQVILSPLQLVRQVYQLPVLGIMAHTNPKDWWNAGITLLSKSEEAAAERLRLMRLGVYDGASQTAELRGDIKWMMDGSFDRMVGEKISKGLRNWESAWRTPDLIVRVSAFQKMEKKLLEEYGLHQAERATNEAIDHMNRYTMNYAAVPPGIKFARQVPFINQYLSFTYEAMRITKNLGEDALKGDPYAIGVLSTMATLPFVAQQMTEAQLSPEDNKAWQRVKNMGRDYERHNFRLVQSRLPNGDFRYISFSPLVLHDPWLQTVRAVMAGDGSAIAAANPIAGWENTPLLNIATTLVSGRNRFTGAKLEGAGAYVKDIMYNAAPILAGPELGRLERALTRNADGSRGLIDERTGKVSTFADLVQTYATSMRPYNVRPSFLEKQAVNEANERIRSQQLTYRSIAATNAAADVKQRAKQNHDRAIKQILLSLQEKLGRANPAPDAEQVP